MKYISTRGAAPALTFKEALLAGLASDGGLYVPESWPRFTPAEIAGFRGQPYTDVAFKVMAKFVDGEISDNILRGLINEAYATFHSPATVPLVQLAPNSWLLELFHGPTLAFKDVAMQILARLMDHILTEQGKRLTIVGATSGDTGGAALAAFKTCQGIDTFFMYPDGRVSDFQRRQMTTVGADNCHAIAIDGSFDDCQAMVKAMFADDAFRDQIQLSAVNSINWGRIMAQVVYYFTAATSLGAPEKKVSFTVPTGNFGDIYAGFVAGKMGLPIDRLVIATNENDILARTLTEGKHVLGAVKPTITPSMDIQISSNFERLLFDASGRDPEAVRDLMQQLKETGGYSVPQAILAQISAVFDTGTATEAETLAEISRVYEASGYVCDPHTAVALHVARQHERGGTAMITLSTAHPAKFPAAVKAATGHNPKPPVWAEISDRKAEIVTHLDNDLNSVQNFILAKSRLGSGQNT